MLAPFIFEVGEEQAAHHKSRLSLFFCSLSFVD